MSYESDMRAQIAMDLSRGTRLSPSEWRRDVDAVCDAIPDGTLKSGGQFVRVERIMQGWELPWHPVYGLVPEA